MKNPYKTPELRAAWRKGCRAGREELKLSRESRGLYNAFRQGFKSAQLEAAEEKAA